MDIIIHFIDINNNFITEIQKFFINIPNIKFSNCSVENIPTNNTAFISPSNSFLFMDGGIDKIYSQIMFPNVEKELKKKLSNIGLKTKLGRYYLRVGSALIQDCSTNNLNTCLISAPTMFLPHDVSNTKNAYYAFMASLIVFNKYKISHPDFNTLVCPALCTGYGKMNYYCSAKQIYEAYCDFYNNKLPIDLSPPNNNILFLTTSKDDEQPDNYDNREIKNILQKIYF